MHAGWIVLVGVPLSVLAFLAAFFVSTFKGTRESRWTRLADRALLPLGLLAVLTTLAIALV